MWLPIEKVDDGINGGKIRNHVKSQVKIELYPYRSDSRHTLHAQIPTHFRPFPQAPAPHSLQHAHFEDI